MSDPIFVTSGNENWFFYGKKLTLTEGLMMKLQIVLEPSDEGGYTVIAPALPGCISEGNTKDEAITSIQEAVALYLEPVNDDKHSAPDAEYLDIVI